MAEFDDGTPIEPPIEILVNPDNCPIAFYSICKAYYLQMILGKFRQCDNQLLRRYTRITDKWDPTTLKKFMDIKDTL